MADSVKISKWLLLGFSFINFGYSYISSIGTNCLGAKQILFGIIALIFTVIIDFFY